MNVNEQNYPILKKTEWLDRLKNKTQIYANYKELTPHPR